MMVCFFSSHPEPVCWLAVVTCEAERAWRRTELKRCWSFYCYGCFCSISLAGNHSATLTERSRGQSLFLPSIYSLYVTNKKCIPSKNNPFRWTTLKLLTLITLNLCWERVEIEVYPFNCQFRSFKHINDCIMWHLCGNNANTWYMVLLNAVWRLNSCREAADCPAPINRHCIESRDSSWSPFLSCLSVSHAWNHFKRIPYRLTPMCLFLLWSDCSRQF